MRPSGKGGRTLEATVMPDHVRGAGVFFFDRARRRVLFYRRDDAPGIPFPGHVDILGGHVEAGETPERAVVREMAEELDDVRTGGPYVLSGHRFFTVYADPQGAVDFLFSKAADFDLEDLRLKEGQSLLWLTEEEAARTPFAFGYDRLVTDFFRALRDGRL
jgi:8-oxo-dGTP diphosphatase